MTGPPQLEHGVSFTAPQGSILLDAQNILNSMTSEMKSDDGNAIIALATDHGWNAAIGRRQGDTFVVAGWIGKTWGGGVTGGAAIRLEWS